MVSTQLIQVAVFLAAAAIAAPLGRSFRMGAVLGYLAAGVVIGPYVLGPLYAAQRRREHPAFRRVRRGHAAVRDRARASPGAALGDALGDLRAGHGAARWRPAWCWRDRPRARARARDQALFVGLALSLSSTAFALQVLEEKGELTTRHGQARLSVLLFQDLAAIPLIALVPLFASGGARAGHGLESAATCHRYHCRA